MEYVIADSNSNEAFWFERSLPTLELAEHAALKYPDARYILEYRHDYQTSGVMPTGRAWQIEQPVKEDAS